MHVLLATEQADLRISLELLLDQEPGVNIIGSVSETEGLLALIRSAQPDIVILEWDLPGRPMNDLLAAARRLGHQAKFIVLGNQPQQKQKALQAGADAFVEKGGPPERLLAAFRELRSGISAIQEPEERKK
jgi:two-component system response regulator DesR